VLIFWACFSIFRKEGLIEAFLLKEFAVGVAHVAKIKEHFVINSNRCFG
jgi:hypothetical protein